MDKQMIEDKICEYENNIKISRIKLDEINSVWLNFMTGDNEDPNKKQIIEDLINDMKIINSVCDYYLYCIEKLRVELKLLD
jgi:hypothetical protein